MKRWNTRRTMAELLGCDIVDVTEYQPGTTSPFHIYDGGNGRNYVVVFPGQEARFAKWLATPSGINKGGGGADAWAEVPRDRVWFREAHPCRIYREGQ